MKRISIIVEGETEERFVQNSLVPALLVSDVYASPIIVGIPGHKGGNVNYPRVRNDIVTKLKQDRNAYCSTMLDFYGLGKGFPPALSRQNASAIQKAEGIENAIKADICAEFPDLRPDLRLFPYLSLHEYEALLFSYPEALAQAIRQPNLASHFLKIRDSFATPEDINDGPNTAPSKRIEAVYPSYRKVEQGSLAAKAVGIDRMRAECPHFNAWLQRLETLPRLP